MSLKSNLQTLIKEMSPEVLTLDALEKYCHQYKAKLSQAERRLRPSESPNVEGIKKNGAIVAYKWKQSEFIKAFMRDFPSKPVKVPDLIKDMLF